MGATLAAHTVHFIVLPLPPTQAPRLSFSGRMVYFKTGFGDCGMPVGKNGEWPVEIYRRSDDQRLTGG